MTARSISPLIRDTHVAGGTHDLTERIKRILIAESGAALAVADLPGDEPLAGELLQLNSMRLLSVLVELEDEPGYTLPDDLFAGRDFHTVDDLVRVVAEGLTASEEVRTA